MVISQSCAWEVIFSSHKVTPFPWLHLWMTQSPELLSVREFCLRLTVPMFSQFTQLMSPQKNKSSVCTWNVVPSSNLEHWELGGDLKISGPNPELLSQHFHSPEVGRWSTGQLIHQKLSSAWLPDTCKLCLVILMLVGFPCKY